MKPLLVRQFTATVYVFQSSKVLLHKHPKHNKWLPPGGHVEQNELPHEAAIREALEETGLHIKIQSQDNITLDAPHAKSLPRPFLCLLENIPARKNEPAHQHIDMIYLSVLADENLQVPLAPFKWMTYEDTLRIPDEELFLDTRLLLNKIFSEEPVEIK